MQNVSLTFKYVISQLHALMAREGYCFASDGALAKMLGVAERRTVQKYLKTLEAEGYIRRELIDTERRIYPTKKMEALFFTPDKNKNSEGYEQKFREGENKRSEGYEQTFSHNNISNNKSNNKVKDSLFSSLYELALKRIKKDDDITKILLTYPERVYELCYEKFMANKDTIRNKAAYLRQIIINTCREHFAPIPECMAGDRDYADAEHRMWETI